MKPGISYRPKPSGRSIPSSEQPPSGLLEWRLARRAWRSLSLRGPLMKQHSSGLRQWQRACVGAALAASVTLVYGVTLEPLPDDSLPAAAADGTTQITQTREQNAVTSVRVKRGGNVYHVTPAEQIPSHEGGGRAAQWEIFEFRSKSTRDRPSAPPPPSR